MRRSCKKNEQERIAASLPVICSWYKQNRRILPWRENATAYTIWISEIMLQQTRIEAVIPYYARFLREVPDIAALAALDEDTLLKLWEGLGYYSRARNLKKAAKTVMEQYGGELPGKAEELKKLPGIGAYTAGAIASIAYGEAEPAVDGNVLRVITRLLACSDDIKAAETRKKITSLLKNTYPAGEDAGLATEGLMELGEVKCLPNAVPVCDTCPLGDLCLAHISGKELCFPVKSGVKERRVENRTVFLLRCGEKYAIRKRPGSGLLANLWEFPNTEGTLQEDNALLMAEDWGAEPVQILPCGNAKHIFTHVEWQMTGYHITCGQEAEGFLWLLPEEIAAGILSRRRFVYFRRCCENGIFFYILFIRFARSAVVLLAKVRFPTLLVLRRELCMG